MITSKKGEEMYLKVTPIYENSPLMQTIFEAIGTEADGSIDLGDKILRQLHPQTAASWGLTIWERRLKLVTNLNEDIEKRIRKVITKLQIRYPINPETMASILKSYTGAIINIIEDVAPYTFRVELTSHEGFPDDLVDVYDTVKKIKPSHLSVQYNLVSVSESPIYYHMATLSDEIIAVYPWDITNIQAKGTMEIGISQSSGAEIIATYPKS